MSGETSMAVEHSAKDRVPYLDEIVQGDCSTLLRYLPNECVDAVVTSPPYYQQRDYGGLGLGNESSVEEYIEKLVAIFEQCVRCVKRTGSIFFQHR
ncbi:MAG: site-specific DNA-methyltransferase [Fimbriimonadales bacterium]|nr:site-specific DNA-methyltransferase [Fimbriimonadales bacterium]